MKPFCTNAGILLLGVFLGGCGGSSQTTSFTLSPIAFEPTTATVSNSTCTANMTLTSSIHQRLTLQAMQHRLTTDNAAQTVNRNTEDLDQLFDTLVVSIGTTLSAAIEFDLSTFPNNDPVTVTTVLIASNLHGKTVTFSGTLTCAF